MAEPLLFEQISCDERHSKPVFVLKEIYGRLKRSVSLYEVLVDHHGGATLVLSHDRWGPYITTEIPFSVPHQLRRGLLDFINNYQFALDKTAGYCIITPERGRYTVVWPSEIEPLIRYVEDNLLPQFTMTSDCTDEQYTHNQIETIVNFARSNDPVALNRFQKEFLDVDAPSDPSILFIQLRAAIESCNPASSMLPMFLQRERAFLDEHSQWLFRFFKNRNGLLPFPDLFLKSGLLVGAIFNHIEEFQRFADAYLCDHPEFQRVTIARSIWLPFEFDIKKFLSSPHLEQLKYLEFNNCDVGEGGIDRFVSSHRFKKLEHLAIYHERIGDLLPNILAKGNFDSLNSLTIYGTSLTFRGLESLFAAPWFSRVKHLYLGDTLLSDPGINSLLSYPNLKELSTLVLSHTNMSTSAVLRLAQSPNLSGLDNLVIVGDKLSVEATTELRNHFGGRVVVY